MSSESIINIREITMKIAEEIKNFRDKITAYFESKEFYEFVKENTSPNFMKDYFEILKKYLRGGKCIRGYLVSLGYKICGGKQHTNDIVKAATAYEIFESAILAQDDMMDKGEMRRGIPSMYVYLGGDHNAKSITTTIADAGFFLSNQLLSSTHFDAKTLIETQRIQNKIYIKTACGQLADLNLSTSEDYTEDEVLQMYELKTANYTIIGPMLIGATLAGAKPKQIKEIQNIGLNLGLIFQIKDDYLGIFGNEKEMGKTQCVDIIEGKKTILTAHFQKYCTPIQNMKFKHYYGRKAFGQQKAIMKLFTDTQTKDYVEAYSEKLAKETNSILSASSFQPADKKKLSEFIDFLLSRKK